MTALPRLIDRDDADARAALLARANINPTTGLATDYLNHFNEAIMQLELLAGCPEHTEEFLSWQPKSYREHFAQSRLRHRQLAIDAYDTADPHARERLEQLADAMTAALRATRSILDRQLSPSAVSSLATWSAHWLRPLVAEAGSVINGDRPVTNSPPQNAVDLLLKR